MGCDTLDNQNDVMADNTSEMEQDIFADSAEELEISIAEEETNSNDFKLSSGDALNEKELYLLSAKKDTRIIYVLGPVGSGKTTFETMLYECFLEKVDEDLMFAGSETLMGFEERLNYLRVISGNSDAKMERTYMKEERCFLQLSLLKKQKENCSIVFADISGEIFERCSSNKTNLEEDLKNLDIAQNIVLFMDGSALLDKAKRQEVVSKIRNFLLTFKSSKLYREYCHVDIVISKNDIIYEKTFEEKDGFIENIDKRFDDLKNQYNINFFRIEALNGFKMKDSDKSTSLLELLKYWLDDDVKKVRKGINKAEKKILRNEFNRFGEVYLV